MSWEDVEKSNGQAKDKIPFTKFSEGNTMIRILDEEPYSFWQHWINSQQTSVICSGKDCPICHIIAQAKANKETPPYKNTKRHAMRIWNYTTDRMEIMIQSKGFMTQLLTLHKEIGDLRNYDVKVIRKGSGIETTYMVMPSAPSDFKLTDRIEEVNMAETFKTPTREEILQILDGKTWAEIRGEDNVA